MTRSIPDLAVDFISKWEGCVLTAYLDIADPPIITIGYGHTGPDVRVGQKITQAQAKALLKDDLRKAAARIAERIGPVVEDLTEGQYAALLSFVFNLGANPGWTIWKVLKARRFDGVPAQLVRFNRAGGKVVRGLVRRRAEEVVLWESEAADEPLPSSATRFMATPPAPDAVKPLGASKSFMTTGATVLATMAAAAAPLVDAAKNGVEGVMRALTPYTDKSEGLNQWVSYLAMAAAGLAVAALVFQWLKQRGAAK